MNKALPTAFARLMPAALLGLAATACSVNINLDGEGSFNFDYEGAEAERSESGALPPGMTRLILDNRFGEIDVEGVDSGDGSWSWELKTWGDTEIEAQQYLQEIRLVRSQDDTDAMWELEIPDDTDGLRGLKSRMVFRVPHSVDVMLDNSFGPTRVHKLDGRVVVDSAHGSVSLRDLRGEVKADTSFAKLEAEDLQNGCELDNSHGSVIVKNVHGYAEVETSFGELRATGLHSGAKLDNSHGSIHGAELSGIVKADTSFGKIHLAGDLLEAHCDNSHGGIELDLTNPDLRKVKADTSFANVKLTVPAGYEAQLDLHASFGSVHSDLPFNFSEDSGNSLTVANTKASSDHRIDLKSSHGNVTLKRR